MKIKQKPFDKQKLSKIVDKLNEPEENIRCVQCFNIMLKSYKGIPFCDNHECPNFGLLQSGMI